MSGEGDELVRAVRAIIDGNLYMTIATADGAGRPWPTPVFYVPVDDCELVWVSSPDAQHSRNLAVRTDVGIVIFDSTAAIGTGQGVYMSGSAGVVPVEALARCLEVFSRSCEERGGSPWSVDAVGPDGRFRLYRATMSERWILDEHDRRIAVPFDPAPRA